MTKFLITTSLLNSYTYYNQFYNKHDKLWSSYQVEAALLKAKVEELGFEFDAKAKEFKVKETKKEGK